MLLQKSTLQKLTIQTRCFIKTVLMHFMYAVK